MSQKWRTPRHVRKGASDARRRRDDAIGAGTMLAIACALCVGAATGSPFWAGAALLGLMSLGHYMQAAR